jgi:hypothetical protein
MTVFDDGLDGGPLLYVVGDFLNAGDIPVDRIATWNGAEWAPLAGGGTNGFTASLNVWDDGSGDGPALYVGGSFTMAGGIDAKSIARWDGVEWSPLGSGLDGGSVYAMAMYDDGSGPVLYAAGSFTTAGGVEADGIAKWDGKQWSAIPGGGIDGPSSPIILSLRVFDDGLSDHPALYLAGRFTSAGGVDAQNIARWDGRTWSALGQGLHDIWQGASPIAWALEVFDDGTGDGPALFASGDFRFAGNFSSQRIAKWIVCPDTIPGDIDGDGSVGVKDLLILLGSWGPCADCNDCIADLDDDCTVGVGDLLILLGNWG